MCLMKGRGGRGPCALGGAPRRRREAARDAAPDLPRGLHEYSARLGRREVGLEEEVEERRRALEVHEEERRRELKLCGKGQWLVSAATRAQQSAVEFSPWNLISTRGSTLNGTHQQTGTSWWSDAKTK